MIEFYEGRHLIMIIEDCGCVEREIVDGIDYNTIYEKFKDRFSEDVIETAFTYDVGYADDGKELIIVRIEDLL